MLNLKNLKKDIASGDIFHKIVEFFGRNFKALVFILFFAMSGFCGYIWYSYAFNHQWSEEKKATYLETKEKEVTFNRKKFQDIVEKERQRSQEYEKTITAEKDIFGIK